MPCNPSSFYLEILSSFHAAPCSVFHCAAHRTAWHRSAPNKSGPRLGRNLRKKKKFEKSMRMKKNRRKSRTTLLSDSLGTVPRFPGGEATRSYPRPASAGGGLASNNASCGVWRRRGRQRARMVHLATGHQ